MLDGSFPCRSVVCSYPPIFDIAASTFDVSFGHVLEAKFGSTTLISFYTTELRVQQLAN